MEISDEVFINSMNDISKYFQIMLDNKDKRIADLQSQLDQQKTMWNELKEFIVEQINFDKEEIEENKEIPNLPNRHYLTIENIILEKMQELQNGDFSGE